MADTAGTIRPERSQSDGLEAVETETKLLVEPQRITSELQALLREHAPKDLQVLTGTKRPKPRRGPSLDELLDDTSGTDPLRPKLTCPYLLVHIFALDYACQATSMWAQAAIFLGTRVTNPIYFLDLFYGGIEFAVTHLLETGAKLC